MIRKLTGVVAALMLAAACGGPQTSSSSGVRAACASTTNMNDELCSCIAELAEERLSDDSVRLLTALLKGDEAESKRLREKMPLTEIAETGGFMASAPATCTAELAE